MRHLVVTSFSPAGYQGYARRFLETFLEFWAPAVELHAYVDEPPSEPQSPRVRYLPMPPALAAFKERHGGKPIACGRPGNAYDYRYDAVRFAHPSYVRTAAGLADDLPDRLYWVDADCVTHAPVTEAFLEGLLPEPAYTAYLGRPGLYTETGFLAWNCRHRAHRAFMRALRDVYDRDILFELPQWHDCEAYDYVRQAFEAQRVMTSHNLGAGIRHTHVFVNSRLGEVMDHLKGPRKDAGRTPRSDLVWARPEPYWRARP